MMFAFYKSYSGLFIVSYNFRDDVKKAVEDIFAGLSFFEQMSLTVKEMLKFVILSLFFLLH